MFMKNKSLGTYSGGVHRIVDQHSGCNDAVFGGVRASRGRKFFLTGVVCQHCNNNLPCWPPCANTATTTCVVGRQCANTATPTCHLGRHAPTLPQQLALLAASAPTLQHQLAMLAAMRQHCPTCDVGRHDNTATPTCHVGRLSPTLPQQLAVLAANPRQKKLAFL